MATDINRDLYAEWIARIAAGHRLSEAQVVNRFFPAVQFLLRTRILSDHLVMDLAQESLLCVLLALRSGQLRDASKLPAFVRSTVLNVANSALRRDALERNYLGRSDPEVLGAIDQPLPDLLELHEMALLVHRVLM